MYKLNKKKLQELFCGHENPAKLSEKLGINRSYSYKFRDGDFNSVGSEILEKIANHFNKPVSYFFDEEPSSNSQLTMHDLSQIFTTANNDILQTVINMGSIIAKDKDEIIADNKRINVLIIENKDKENEINILKLKLENADTEICNLKKTVAQNAKGAVV